MVRESVSATSNNAGLFDIILGAAISCAIHAPVRIAHFPQILFWIFRDIFSRIFFGKNARRTIEWAQV